MATDNWAAIILAAGKGTRMNSGTPKVLHSICGKAMVELVAETVTSAGIAHTIVVVPADSEPFKQILGTGVRYAEQVMPLGSGHALSQARAEAEGMDRIVVLCADVPLTRAETLTRMMEVHGQRNASITVLTGFHGENEGLGRVVRSETGAITEIVEERDADEATLSLEETNGGIYCFDSIWLWQNIDRLTPSPQGEIYLTDLIAMASKQGELVESVTAEDPTETFGVNTRVQLASAESALRERIREQWMLAGVSMPDPSSVYISVTARLGRDTILLPNTHITGDSAIGRDCQIGPNSIVSDSEIGDRCRIVSSVVEGSTLDEAVSMGPFSHIRAGSHLGQDVYIGNYAEVKNSRLGRGSKSGHFSYLGDAELGRNVNIGAGTITCNYDGDKKNQTKIGDDAFIGSDSMLVAPIEIGARASTGAGSVVNRDVPPDSIAVGAPARIFSKSKKPDTSSRRAPKRTCS